MLTLQNLFFMKKLCFFILGLLSLVMVKAQITTTGAISGYVFDKSKTPLVGANVKAVHEPTGSEYTTTTSSSGFYSFNAVRVGGPYTIMVTYVGLESQKESDVFTDLGQTTNIDFALGADKTTLETVVVQSNRNSSFSRNKTGATQTFGRKEILNIPTIGSRNISDITKYNSQGNGRSFGGVDSRYNNFSIDGSVLNDGFGLSGGNAAGQAGGRTGIFPISIDAIEQIQVNIAPFDVRQSGFVGAGINAVTRSGTNEIEASAYGTYNDNTSAFLGTTAYKTKLTNVIFNQQLYGGRIGFPIVKNKLFAFVNFEGYNRTAPALSLFSTGSPNAGGSTNISRPRYTLLDSLSKYLQSNFNYATGPWENYNAETKATKFLAKIDWNINENNKINFRFISQLSSQYNPISNSSAVGIGNRININSLSYQNSGYTQNANTTSGVVEWNSQFSKIVSNNLIIGYDYNNEDRAKSNVSFPTVDIRNGAGQTTLVSFGNDPFSPSNQLNYSLFHITENITIDKNKNKITAGFNYEYFKSNNVFFPGSNGVYVFDDVNAFYAAANQSIANGGKPSTLTTNNFLLRYSLLPNNAEPLQVLESSKLDFYAQDENHPHENLTLIFGIRTSLIWFGNTALNNPVVSALNFGNDNTQKYSTNTLPGLSFLIEPRFGFNWDILGNKSFILRGGTGIFTGRPPYVFISNAVGNNGILTTTTAAGNYGFTANPALYFTPTTPGANSTLDLAFNDPGFKFPQAWKNNIALEYRLPFGLNFSVEYLYNYYLNAVNYTNANFSTAPRGRYNINAGGDARVYYGVTGSSSSTTVGNSTRINANVQNAIVLGNRSGAFNSQLTLKIEMPTIKGFYGFIAYTKSESKDFMSAGSIAASSWTGARSATNNNELGLANTDNLVPDRFVGLLSYKIDYGKPLGGATTITLGVTAQQNGVFSYTINGDLNRDGVFGNELMYVPTDAQIDNMLFETTSTFAYTQTQQREALKSFIAQDPYLSNIRGQYSERNAAVLPFFLRADISIAQDIFYYTNHKKGGKQRHGLQLRFDLINLPNLINAELGVSSRPTSNGQILNLRNYGTVSGAVNPVYQLATQTNVDGSTTLINRSFQTNASVFEVWQMQIGLRYYFGSR